MAHHRPDAPVTHASLTVARPRRQRPVTPFGLWLEQWLEEHPDVTFEALGQEVGVTKSAISLWLTATHQAKIAIPRLRRLAVYTGAKPEYLEQLVYGTPPAEESSAPVSPSILEAVRTAISETFGSYESTAAARAARPPADADEVHRRRTYWIRIARLVSDTSEQEIARRAGVSVKDVRAWEKGARLDDDLLPTVARAYELPLSVLREPPETDRDVVRTFRMQWLAEQDRVSLSEVADRQSA